MLSRENRLKPFAGSVLAFSQVQIQRGKGIAAERPTKRYGPSNFKLSAKDQTAL